MTYVGSMLFTPPSPQGKELVWWFQNKLKINRIVQKKGISYMQKIKRNRSKNKIMTAFLFYFLLFVIDACLWPLKKRHCIRRILKTERQDYSLSLFFKGMVVYCSYMFIRWLQIFIINNKWCYKLCSFILNLMTSMQTDGRTHTRIDIHIKICKHTGTRAYIHTHLFKHTDTYTYTRSHTHIHTHEFADKHRHK